MYIVTPKIFLHLQEMLYELLILLAKLFNLTVAISVDFLFR